MAEKEYQLRENPPTPDYFKYDQIKKEEFLSQLGNYTQEQRVLFRKICEFWEPELDYERFLKKEKDGYSFLDNHLRTLMGRLGTSRCGLLHMKIQKGELTPGRIILCEPDSIRFFYYSLENEYLAILLREDKVFITDDYLLEAGITIPAEMVEELNLEDLSNDFLYNHKNHVRLLSITIGDSEPVICTPWTIEHIIRISRENVRNFLANTAVLSFIAKLMGSMNSEVLKHIGTTDMVFWNKLTSVMLEHQEDILNKRKNAPPDTYNYVSLLFAYTKNGLDESERIRQENQAKKDEMIRVCKNLFEKKEPFVDQHELNTFLDAGLKQWQDFKELFFEKCVKLKNKTGLPIIVNIGTGYLHRDRLYQVFTLELKETSEELKEYYRIEMERLLTSANRGDVTCFSTHSTFVHHIQDMVNTNKPILSALLKKPKLVSEAVILHGKKGVHAQTPEQIRQILDHYFEEESTLHFRKLDHMLDLYLLPIYKSAYEKLSFWRRIIMKIFGKHESFIATFSGRVGPNDRRKSPREKEGTYRAADLKLTRNIQKSELTIPANKRGVPRGSYGSSKSKKSLDPKSRGAAYSYRQINRAWKDFEDAMQKKD